MALLATPAPRQPPRTTTVPTAAAINPTKLSTNPTPRPHTPSDQSFHSLHSSDRDCSTSQRLHQLIKSNPNQAILLFFQHNPLHLHPHAFPPTLKSCGKLAATSEGTQIHCLAVKTGVFSDPYVNNSLIQMYFGCGLSTSAQVVFDRMLDRNVVSWNCVIAGYAEMGLWEDVKALFKEMVGEGSVVPNSITLARVVTACTRTRDLGTGVGVHSYVVERGMVLGVELGNALVNMYAKLGEMGEARGLFDRMVDRDVVSWTTLVSGYAGAGDVKLARGAFDMMPLRNVVAWNAMIAGYVLNGCFDEAILLFKEMQDLSGRTYSLEDTGTRRMTVMLSCED